MTTEKARTKKMCLVTDGRHVFLGGDYAVVVRGRVPKIGFAVAIRNRFFGEKMRLWSRKYVYQKHVSTRKKGNRAFCSRNSAVTVEKCELRTCVS